MNVSTVNIFAIRLGSSTSFPLSVSLIFCLPPHPILSPSLPLAHFHFSFLSLSLCQPPTSSQHISLCFFSLHLSPPPTMFSFNLSLQKCVQLQSSQIAFHDLVLLLPFQLILPVLATAYKCVRILSRPSCQDLCSRRDGLRRNEA